MGFPSGSCPPLLPLAMSCYTRTCWQSTLCAGNSTERPLSSAMLLITTWCARWWIPAKTTSLTKLLPVTRLTQWNLSELVASCDEYGLFSRRDVLQEGRPRSGHRLAHLHSRASRNHTYSTAHTEGEGIGPGSIVFVRWCGSYAKNWFWIKWTGPHGEDKCIFLFKERPSPEESITF